MCQYRSLLGLQPEQNADYCKLVAEEGRKRRYPFDPATDIHWKIYL